MPSKTALFFQRWLVRAYPTELFARSSSEWAPLFQQLYDDQRRRGSGYAAIFLLRNLLDALVFGLPARLASALRRHGRRVQVPTGGSGRQPSTRRVERSNAVFRDLRLACRTLTHSPLFTLTAVLSLALGIGVNTAMFSILDRVLLRTLPVPNPDALVFLYHPGPLQGRSSADEGGGANGSATRCSASCRPSKPRSWD
jgi:hypothetical protein